MTAAEGEGLGGEVVEAAAGVAGVAAGVLPAVGVMAKGWENSFGCVKSSWFSPT